MQHEKTLAAIYGDFKRAATNALDHIRRHINERTLVSEPISFGNRVYIRFLHRKDDEITFTVFLKQMRPAIVVSTCLEIARTNRRRWKTRHTFNENSTDVWTLSEQDLVKNFLHLYSQIPRTMHDSKILITRTP